MDETDMSVESAASDTTDWGSAINSGISNIGGIAALFAPKQQVQQPVTVAGPIAANPNPNPSFAAKLGMPLWALITGGVVLVLGVVWAVSKLLK